MNEVYILLQKRNEESIYKFLDVMLPNRMPLQEDYPFPELVDNPKFIYSDSDDLIKKLIKELNETYSLYWKNKDNSDIETAMLFFMEDGGIVGGIVVPCSLAESYLQKLKKSFQAVYGYVEFDSAPPMTQKEFIENCKLD